MVGRHSIMIRFEFSVLDMDSKNEISSICLEGNMYLLYLRRQIIDFIEKFGKPKQITCISQNEILSGLDIAIVKADDISALDDASFDDVIYFGSNPKTAEAIFCKIAPKGLFNIVLCGNKFGTPVVTQVGRVHYGGIRIIGAWHRTRKYHNHATRR